MIDHNPWMGPNYKEGLDGQRIAIVGYSHWLEKGKEDNVDATIECIRSVQSDEWKIAFFTQVRNYFGYNNHEAFWGRVMFFNFLPCCVGTEGERYRSGTPEQRTIGQTRFLRLLGEKLPQKVFVLTGRHWAFPVTSDSPKKLGLNFPNFSCGTYGFENDHVVAFFLRHPQGANKNLMMNAVKNALAMPVSRDIP